jgi:hypothetical protein
MPKRLLASTKAVSRSADAPKEITNVGQTHIYNAKENYDNLCRNMAMVSNRCVALLRLSICTTSTTSNARNYCAGVCSARLA